MKIICSYCMRFTIVHPTLPGQWIQVWLLKNFWICRPCVALKRGGYFLCFFVCLKNFFVFQCVIQNARKNVRENVRKYVR